MIQQEVDVLHYVLDVHVGRLPLDQLLSAAKGPFVEETVDINCECLAWKIKRKKKIYSAQVRSHL